MVAPPGKVILELDHATLEVRVIGHVANDRTYIDIYKKDGDPHLETGLRYAKKPIDQLTKQEIKTLRQKAKPVVFGMAYQISSSGLRAYARTFGVEMSKQEADNIHAQYFRDHPDIAAWHNKTERDIRKYKGVRTIFGRFRHLPGIKAKDQSEQAKAVRVGINVQIQNPASDLTLLGGLNIIKDSEYVQSSAIQGTIFLHDALFFEIDEEMLEHYVTLCKNHMETVDIKSMFGFDLKVPLKVDAEYGYDLANTNEL